MSTGAVKVGVDTGGTFTDVVTGDGRTAKVLSTPGDPAHAVREGVHAVAGRSGAEVELLAHGTTVATNAVLEGTVARVALVTNAGLADVIEIARQDRPSLYDRRVVRPPALVAPEARLEVPGRLDATGRELEPVDVSTLGPQLEAAGAAVGPLDAVAVCLLHADLDGAHERAVAAEVARLGIDVSCSHEVSPELREYERTVTTVVNAALRPVCRSYLHGLDELAGEVLVMTSAGGLLPARDAAELPAALLLSGPAGGVSAGAAAARANGFDDAVTFDMGGTSTDVCLVLGGRPAPAAARTVGGYRVRFPALDIHTIGAGGGSIARIDPGGALQVGPRSAGATPGPACYGRGGVEPTVTDADLVLGRIPRDAVFGSIVPDVGLAREALARAGTPAEGVIAVVNAAMERALRSVSVERGVDPRGLALVAFGGAGPLHACELADALGMAAVVVPARAGVLSAVGLLSSPRRRDVVRSWPTPPDHRGLPEALEALGRRAAGLVGAGPGVEVEVALDCRYEGQSHELTVPSVDAFPAAHRARNGFDRPGAPVEVIALRATARRPAPVGSLPAVAPQGAVGPAVLAHPECTIWVPAGWSATPGAEGALVLRRRR